MVAVSEHLAGARLAARAGEAMAVPLQHALGAQLLDQGEPTVGAWFRVEHLATNGAGGLHAAALAAVLELAGYLALLPHLGVDEHAVTHAVATQLVAAAREGQRVEGRGEVDRRARRVAFLSVVATVEGRTIARAQLTKSIVEFR